MNKFGIDTDLAQQTVKKTVKDTASKAVDDIINNLPPELEPFREAVKAALDGDTTEAVIKVVMKLLPLVGIAIAVIIVGFIIKWWVGLLAIPCAIVWLAYRVLRIINGIRKFVTGLPKSIIGTLGDLDFFC